jgi:photosystem II stability/assembly factor-like uncharacterized protein
MTADPELREMIGAATDFPAELLARTDAAQLVRMDGRQILRRRRAFALVGALAVTGAVLAGVIATTPGPAATPKPVPLESSKPQPRPSAIMTVPSSVPPKDITAVQMFSSQAGVAIARIPLENPCNSACQEAALLGAGNDYLAATNDGGATWHIKGIVPEQLRSIGATKLAFRNVQTGYLLQSGPSRATVYITIDGGETWTSLLFAHSPTSVSISGNHLWVVTNDCAYSPTLHVAPGSCPSRLVTFQAGDTSPISDQPVPAPPLPTRGNASINATDATVIGRLGQNSGIIRSGAGEIGADIRLLFTQDSGLHWQAVTNPCRNGLPITGIVESIEDRWVADCETGTHENQVAIYLSADRGRHWSMRAAANPEGSTRGHVGDYAADAIVSSDDHKVLWRVGTAVGLDASTDGGRTWQSVYVPTGYSTTLVTAGDRGAWLPAPYNGLWRTLDGIHWSPIR